MPQKMMTAEKFALLTEMERAELRPRFAMAALPAVIAALPKVREGNESLIAKRAFAIADACMTHLYQKR